MRRSVVLVVAIVLAAAFAATSFAAVPDTKAMVLRLSDLPAGFALDKGYYADNRRAARESSKQTLAQFTRWGRINGYEADFSRTGVTGILSIASASSTYKTAKGAADSTHDSYSVEGKTQRFNGKPVVFKRVSTGRAKIGTEARMFSATIKNQGITVIVYVVLWRSGAVKASVLVAGVSGTVDAAEAVRLALNQQTRIAAVLR